MILDIYRQCNSDEGCMGRWERWEEHRHRIGSILKEKVFADKSVESIVVVGAGRCDDLDLSLLADHARSVTLVDYDRESIGSAVARQELTAGQRQKFILKGGVEFTGFYEGKTVDELMHMVNARDSEEHILNFIKERAAAAESGLSKLAEEGKYSLVISGAVHSQLIIPYAQTAASQGEYAAALSGIAAAVADILAEKYNDGLLALAGENGLLFTYFDVTELSERNQTAAYENLINAMLRQKEDEGIDDLLSRHSGVAGARHGFADLSEKLPEACQNNWIWQFRENKKYYVKSLCGRKNA